MPFARTTKDELMVLSARRCCVCHRYKGVGVEVHHIVPEAKGGSNETENGIVLCFDCHAAAGHYNPAHPRGTKFSPSELRQHREEWFDYVSKNLGSMRGPEHSDTVVGRYLMTADRICAKKIIERDPTSLVQSTYVFVDTKLKTAFYDLHRKYSHATPDHETDGFLNEFYVNRSELYKQFPELAGRERAALSMRIVNRGCLRDPFANLLIAKGAIPEQVGSVSAFHESCGDSGWGIDVHTRRPHYVFFQIENIGNDVAILDRVILKKYINMDILPSDDGWLTVTMAAIDGRNLAIRPSETLTIFLGIICGPLDFDPLSYTYVDSEELGQNSDDQETVEKLSYTVDGVKEDFVTVGGLSVVSSINYSVTSAEMESVVPHEFDPTCMFFLSREWLIGSCPHAYGIRRDGTAEHIKAVFENGFGILDCIEELDVAAFDYVVLAELDRELSTISEILRDGIPTNNTVFLTHGSLLMIPTRNTEDLVLRGGYVARIPRPRNLYERRQQYSKRVAFEREYSETLAQRCVRGEMPGVEALKA